MAEEKKRDVPNLEGLFDSGDDVTGEQLLDKMYVSDENLILKTDIKDPMAVTTVRLFAEACREPFPRVSKLLEFAVQFNNEAMVSHNRLSREEMKEMWVALMETNMRKREGLADQIFGGSR